MNYTKEDEDLYLRHGRISIAASFIRRRPALLKAILGDCVVVHTEYNGMSDTSTFWVHHSDFRIVEDGASTPNYTFTLCKPDLAVLRDVSYKEYSVKYVEVR